MESEAVLSIPVEARWLFIIIMLSADDVGLFEAKEFRLARRSDLNQDLVGKLLLMLADADLIRFYEVDGKRYGFIPKFGQRLQIKKTKYPLPPAAFYSDDADTINKINNLMSKTVDGQMMHIGDTDDVQPPEAESEAEGRVSVSQNSSSSSIPRRRRKAANRVPDCPYDDIVKAYHELLPELPPVRVLKPASKRAKAILELWKWVLTSSKSDGGRRATTVQEGVQWMRGYFQRARDNDFIMGRTPRGAGHENWEADIDYLCSEKGMKQVIEKTKVVT